MDCTLSDILGGSAGDEETLVSVTMMMELKLGDLGMRRDRGDGWWSDRCVEDVVDSHELMDLASCSVAIHHDELIRGFRAWY